MPSSVHSEGSDWKVPTRSSRSEGAEDRDARASPQMDTKIAEKTSAPTSATDYAAAIESTGSGEFTSRLSNNGRVFFASVYGAPFYAIARQAPEVLEAPSARVLFGGSTGTIAADGGRWLSLYAKALRTSCKLTSTVCVSTKPRPLKAPKPLLFQVPQQVLVKPWHKYLRESDATPDVLVLYAADSFSDQLATIDELALLGPRYKTLMAFQSRAEAIVIQHLLRARGFEVGNILGFDKAEGKSQHFSSGAWWIAISPLSAGRLTALKIGLTDTLHACYRVYEGYINRAGSQSAAGAVAAVYGTRAAVQVNDDTAINTVLLSPDGGIDLSSGRFFSRPNESNSEEVSFVWEEKALGTDLLDLTPDDKPELSPDENRFQMMSWLGRALTEDVRRSELPDDDIAEGVEDQTRDGGPSDEPLNVSASTEDVAAQPTTSAIAALQSIEPAKPRKLRSRLSRCAGTVNVLAIAARLGVANKESAGSFENARSRILSWLGNKGYANLDPTGNNHIEMPSGEVSIETDGKSVWSLRFDDRQQMEAGSLWRVEATLIDMAQPAIGLRLAQVRRTDDAPEPVSGVPTVIAKIAEEVGLHDAGVPLLNRPVDMRGESGATQLIQLLLNAERSQAVVVVSGDAKPDASVDRLATRLAGLAHVINIDAATAKAMIRTVGRERSVFGNAIRLYRPGFNIVSDPFQHRVWTVGGSQLPVRVANDIAEEACAISLEVGDVDERVPSFFATRNMLSETRIQALRKQTENIASTAEEERVRQEAIRVELESVLDKYKRQDEELAQRVGQLQSELQTTRRERDSALDDVRHLRRQRDNQWVEEEAQEIQLTDESYFPDTWDELEDWVEIYGGGKLVLLPQAAKAARESPFIDISFAYRTLDYLVRYYVPMRTRDKDDTEAFQDSQQVLAELGLELSSVGVALDDKRYKHEYRRQYDGRTICLDDHLKKGVGFDPAVIFRLYFHYDEATAKAVVGHLPTHLTNRITHSG